MTSPSILIKAIFYETNTLYYTRKMIARAVQLGRRGRMATGSAHEARTSERRDRAGARASGRDRTGEAFRATWSARDRGVARSVVSPIVRVRASAEGIGRRAIRGRHGPRGAKPSQRTQWADRAARWRVGGDRTTHTTRATWPVRLRAKSSGC